jgi:hypothetical protein
MNRYYYTIVDFDGGPFWVDADDVTDAKELLAFWIQYDSLESLYRYSNENRIDFTAITSEHMVSNSECKRHA